MSVSKFQSCNAITKAASQATTGWTASAGEC